MAAPVTAAIALRRSCSENSTGMKARIVGRISAPPRPSTARAAMNVPGEPA
jgi:hypothetical protein